MSTVDVTIGERYAALSANQRAGPGPAPAVLHHPRPMAAPSCSPPRQQQWSLFYHHHHHRLEDDLQPAAGEGEGEGGGEGGG